jgi:hypothetical protein
LGLDDNLISTFFSSPITLTLLRSSYMIFKVDGSTLALILWHTDHDITLDDAPESTIQLCTFLLKILKVYKNGGTILRVLRMVACGFLLAVSRATLSTLFTLLTLLTLLTRRLPLS